MKRHSFFFHTVGVPLFFGRQAPLAIAAKGQVQEPEQLIDTLYTHMIQRWNELNVGKEVVKTWSAIKNLLTS